MAHFCLCIIVCEFCIWFSLGFGRFCVWNGKELLQRMLWMMSSSQLYSSLSNWYASNCGVFMLCGVVGRVGDDSVCKSGFSVNGYFLYHVQFCVWKCLNSLLYCYVLFLL